jgi:biopolymer transport protein ExbD
MTFWDMTPMIDVVLQLIIFFMYTAQFTHMIRSPIDLPKEVGETSETQDPTVIIVDIQHNGSLIVEGKPIDLERLIRMVEVEIDRVGDPARVDLLVRADQWAPAFYVNDLAENLTRLNVRSWKLGTSVPANGASNAGSSPGGGGG